MNKLIIGLLFLAVSFNINSKEVVVAVTQDIAPYSIGNKGLELHLIREIFKKVNIKVKFVKMSFGRVRKEINNGRVDMSSTMIEEKKSGLFYSKNYIYYQNAAITKKSSGIKLEKLSDLNGKHVIAAWQGARNDLGPAYKKIIDKLGKNKYFEMSDQVGQNRFFWAGRAKILVIDILMFEQNKKFMPKKIDTTEETVFHFIFDRRTHFKAAFSDSKLRDAFNKGLDELRKSGEYEKIFRIYSNNI